MLASVHHRPPPSATCTNTIRANAGERSRTGMNETETETGDWAAASRAKSSTCGIQARHTPTAATSRQSSRPADSRYGFLRWSPARCTTSPPPASTPCPGYTGQRPLTCPPLPIPGYDGAGLGILIPVKQPSGGTELDVNTRTPNAIQRSLRCLGERGFALLTGRWRTLQHITASPSKIRRHRPRRTRTDPFRIRLHHMNFAEITSLPGYGTRRIPSAVVVNPVWRGL